MRKFFITLCLLLTCSLTFAVEFEVDGRQLAEPVVDGIFVRPAEGVDAQPVWGFADGIRIGLAPLPGPRGLIRIYTEYLGLGALENNNFIAIEPALLNDAEHHGYSELERSHVDSLGGKIFVSSDTPERPVGWDKYRPARGVISEENGVKVLTVWIFSERFDNGAHVYVRVRFFEDKPYELEIAGYKDADSKPLEEIRLTATMGNKMRLRKLYLADGKVVMPEEYWPGFNEQGFPKRHHTLTSEMIQGKDGNLYVVAAPNEKNLKKAEFTEGKASKSGWYYGGKPGSQYWYASNPTGKLHCTVNARCVYWAIFEPIPGGLAYENFDLNEPFVEGHPLHFGISPLKPRKFIRSIAK